MSDLTHDVMLIVMRKAGGKTLPPTKQFMTDLKFEGSDLLEYVLTTFEGDLKRSVGALISHGDLEAYGMLMETVTDAKVAERLRRHALYTAVLRSDIRVTSALLPEGGRYAVRDALYDAAYDSTYKPTAMYPSHEMCKFLLAQKGAPVSSFGDGVLLRLGMSRGDMEIVRLVSS